MILNPSMRLARRSLVGTGNITSLVPNITSCSKYRLSRFACGYPAPLTGMSRPLCSNRPRCWNCHRSAKVPSLRTFSFRFLTVWAIGLTKATNRPTQRYLPNCRNQNPPDFPRRLSVKCNSTATQPQPKRNLNPYQTHTKRILAASSLAVVFIQPARSPPRSLACLLCL